MSVKTNIQWCDSTQNSIMGCSGCELFPKPGAILKAIDKRVASKSKVRWSAGQTAALFNQLFEKTWAKLETKVDTQSSGHVRGLTTTNLYHLRREIASHIHKECGREAGDAAKAVIDAAVKCYAAQLHLNRATSIVSPNRKRNVGYAKTFEQVQKFEGRMEAAAQWPDLFRTARVGKPWLNGLPRLIFVSDMGDALSKNTDFPFLRREVEHTQTESGRQHLWLWLTKRPDNMARFADSIGGLPDNFCAMTTVTSDKTLSRVDALRNVDCRVRGLSIEPLWTPLAEKLDLSCIDWIITGGESGAIDAVEEYSVEWGEDIQHLCKANEVAYFNKQLGRKPTRNGQRIQLRHPHGGDWTEWEPSLRVRQLPSYFNSFREG